MKTIFWGILSALTALTLFATAPTLAQDWQSVVAAAEKEGAIVINSQPNEVARNFLLKEFPKAYPKIQVSLSVVPTNQFVARVRAERQTNNFLWDVGLAGPPSGFALAHDGALDPVLPEFVAPDIKNPDTWGGWDEAFIDKEKKYVFAIAVHRHGLVQRRFRRAGEGRAARHEDAARSGPQGQDRLDGPRHPRRGRAVRFPRL
jgi:hypothetical protein